MFNDLGMRLAAAERSLQSGDLLTAQTHYFSALEIDESCHDALVNLACLFLTTDRIDAAIATAKRATNAHPNSHRAWANLGWMLAVKGEFDGAADATCRALQIEKSKEAWMNLGMISHALGEFHLAVDAFSKHLELNPDNIEAIDKRSLSMLGAGRFRDGLLDNKIRWQCLACHPLMHSPIPEWDGSRLDGKGIVILHEQGAGDTLQFVRLLPWLKSKAGAQRIVLSIPDHLHGLLAPLADEVIGVNEIPRDVDFKCPMLTVPAHFDLTPDTIPPDPYLTPPRRRPQLSDDGRLKVGLVWAGKPGYADDHWRSCNIMHLLPLVERRDVAWYSLQCGDAAATLWQSGLKAFVTDLAPKIKDWQDTAALVSELDLLISVDTAPAHLAGAMGVPVALMIPRASCWRWLDHSTTTTPWYPSMRLFRQPKQGDWQSVVAAVKAHIEALLDQRKGDGRQGRVRPVRHGVCATTVRSRADMACNY